jgi:hypothetical protein
MAKDLDRTARASRIFQTLSFAKRVQVQGAQLRETRGYAAAARHEHQLWTRNGRRELFNGQDPLAGAFEMVALPGLRGGAQRR